MKTLLLVFNAPTNLNFMNVFEVGSNKKYFNEGKTKHTLNNEIIPSINKAITILTPLSKYQSLNLLICGRTLNYLNENSKETIIKIKEFLRNTKVKLTTSLYFNSHPETLSDDEFEYQLKKHINSLKSILGKKSTTLIVKDFLSETQNEIATELGIRNSITLHSFNTNLKSNIIILNSDFFINNNEKQIYEILTKEKFVPLDKKFISNLNSNNLASTQIKTPLHEHINSEISAFYPLIKKLNDEENLNDLRLLSSAINLNDSEKYENYISIMNSLNDMSYKIKNISLLQQGQDIIPPKIINNPSQTLKSIFQEDETHERQS